MNIVYIVAIACSLIYSIRSGTAQLVPCFAVSLGHLFIVELFYQPHSAAWLHEWYTIAAGVCVAMRILAVAEAFLLHSYGHPKRKQITIWVLMISLALTALMVLQVSGQTPLLSAIQARRVIVVGLFVFLLIYCMLRWSMGEWKQCFASRHILAQLAIAGAYAAASISRIILPDYWAECNFAAYAVQAIIISVWSVSAIPGPPLVISDGRYPASTTQNRA